MGLSTSSEIAVLAVFFVFVGLVGWFRVALDAEFKKLPPGLQDWLGLNATGRRARRGRQNIADRLLIYGVPDYVPLSQEGRTVLSRLRMLMLAFLMILALAPAIFSGSVWGLYTLPLVLAVLGARAFIVGRWPEAPPPA